MVSAPFACRVDVLIEHQAIAGVRQQLGINFASANGTGAGIHRVDIMIQLGHPDAAVHGLTRKGWEWINANFKTRPFPVPRIPQEFAPELVKRIEDEGLTVKMTQGEDGRDRRTMSASRKQALRQFDSP